jgi:hypothetical protein
MYYLICFCTWFVLLVWGLIMHSHMHSKCCDAPVYISAVSSWSEASKYWSNTHTIMYTAQQLKHNKTQKTTQQTTRAVHASHAHWTNNECWLLDAMATVRPPLQEQNLNKASAWTNHTSQHWDKPVTNKAWPRKHCATHTTPRNARMYNKHMGTDYNTQ